MHTYQMVIMILLCFLCFNKASFWGAFTLYVAYCIYAPFIVPMSSIYYYSCAASLNLIVGVILQRHYLVAAMCAYALVFTNVVGFLLWVKFYPHALYDNISAIILIIQISSLLPKGLLNGLRRNIQHSMAKSDGFNGF